MRVHTFLLKFKTVDACPSPKHKLLGARRVRFCNLEIAVEQEADVRTYHNQTVKLYYLVRHLELTNGKNAMYEHKGTKCAEN